MRCGRISDHMGSAVLIQLQVHSGVDRRVLDPADFLVRHEILREGLLFKGLEP